MHLFSDLDRVWHCTWWLPLLSPHTACLHAEQEGYCRSESWFCCPDHRCENTPPTETTLTSYHPLQKDTGYRYATGSQSDWTCWLLHLSVLKPFSPGQGFPWQLRVSVSNPAQWRPPLAGSGLLHRLTLFCAPTPQDTLQGPHSAHSE